MSDTEETEDEQPTEGSKGREAVAAHNIAGRMQSTKRGKTGKRDGQYRGAEEDGMTGRRLHLDVFTSRVDDDDQSPKKRKRSPADSISEAETGSWVEMEEDEEEPEFIAESEFPVLRVGTVLWLHSALTDYADDMSGDQQLLADAPAYALHRLRKAELIRLWKVAGMWTAEDGEDGESVASGVDDEDDGGLSKKDLVDGLIAAVSIAPQ